MANQKTSTGEMQEMNNIETAVKKKRNWVPNPQKDFGQENVEPGDNSRYLRFARVALDLPPIDISDEKQVEMRLTQYFDFCEQNDMKPGMAGMASWLGVDRNTILNWKNGNYRAETHLCPIKKAVAILETLWEGYMQNGKVNPASGIFLAKNQFGYRDQVDIVAKPVNALGEEIEQKALEQKLDDIVAEE